MQIPVICDHPLFKKGIKQWMAKTITTNNYSPHFVHQNMVLKRGTVSLYFCTLNFSENEIQNRVPLFRTDHFFI